MTITPSPLASRSRRQRRGSGVVRWLIRAAILALVFALGVAVGQALEDRPPKSNPVTNISTIRPWTQTQP
ncbi:MAG TPA: hypothetical protein VE440_01100 [Gaiellaceae bacterium]|nr:hypothetical protein [Gaiellaceae bacterium]